MIERAKVVSMLDGYVEYLEGTASLLYGDGPEDIEDVEAVREIERQISDVEDVILSLTQGDDVV